MSPGREILLRVNHELRQALSEQHQHIEQLEVLLSDALRQFDRWENGYAYDAHGEERSVERRIRDALAQSQEEDV